MENTEIHTLKEPLKLHGNAKPIDYSIDPVTGCWNVVSHAPSGKGYPRVKRDGPRTYMHRYSYELAYRPIPDELHCCHHCDNPVCINPEHLFLGTQADNMQDAVRKGRIHSPVFCGEANGNHKLTEADIEAIRVDKTSTLSKLGKKFGIGTTQVDRIKRGLSWKHIPLPEIA